MRSLRVPPGCEATVAWLKTLPAPVRVVYEAGPTGYGLARACAEAGISCVVAAPSRIRPAADRVKTDRRDAERLARLLRLGEITPVRVPGPEEEAARDLVRAREDARGDLMRARHRLSKLLLRHGVVYDATAWTRAHDAWLRRQRFQSGPLAIVFDECYGRMLDAKTRTGRARQGDRRARREPAVRRCRRAARLSPRRLHADGVRVDGRARRLEPVPARVARPVPRAHPERELKRRAAPARRDHQDRQHARTPASDRGRLAPTQPAAHERHAGTQTRPASLSPCEPKPTAAPAGCTDAGTRSRPEASRARSSWSPSRASSPDTAGRSRRWSSRHPQRLGEESAPAQRREERPERTL